MVDTKDGAGTQQCSPPSRPPDSHQGKLHLHPPPQPASRRTQAPPPPPPPHADSSLTHGINSRRAPYLPISPRTPKPQLKQPQHAGIPGHAAPAGARLANKQTRSSMTPPRRGTWQQVPSRKRAGKGKPQFYASWHSRGARGDVAVRGARMRRPRQARRRTARRLDAAYLVYIAPSATGPHISVLGGQKPTEADA